MADDLLTGHVVSGVEVAQPLFRLHIGTGEADCSCKGKGPKAESTNGATCGGLGHTSEERSVMERE